MNFTSVATKVAECKFPLCARLLRRQSVHKPRGAEPAHRRVVIVRTRVHDAVPDVIVRLMRIFGGRIAERKLQDTHAGETPAVAQRLHFGCDIPQILGNERKFPEGFLKRRKQAVSRSFDPASFDRGGCVARDLVILLKAAEVVESHQVYQFQRGAYPVDPPLITGFRQHIPAIEGISPKLTCLAEIVRRDSRNRLGVSLRIKIKDFRVGPDVHAVVRDKNRHISEELDPVVIAIALQGAPLTEELELSELVDLHIKWVRI